MWLSSGCACFVVLIFSLGFIAVQSIEEMELDERNFYQISKDKDVMLVEFYAPWCHHCIDLAPEWKAATDALANAREYIMAKVNCVGAGKSVCEKLDIDAYPAIKLFRHGHMMETYEGPRKASDILEYIQKSQTVSSAQAMKPAYADSWNQGPSFQYNYPATPLPPYTAPATQYPAPYQPVVTSPSPPPPAPPPPPPLSIPVGFPMQATSQPAYPAAQALPSYPAPSSYPAPQPNYFQQQYPSPSPEQMQHMVPYGRDATRPEAQQQQQQPKANDNNNGKFWTYLSNLNDYWYRSNMQQQQQPYANQYPSPPAPAAQAYYPQQQQQPGAASQPVQASYESVPFHFRQQQAGNGGSRLPVQSQAVSAFEYKGNLNRPLEVGTSATQIGNLAPKASLDYSANPPSGMYEGQLMTANQKGMERVSFHSPQTAPVQDAGFRTNTHPPFHFTPFDFKPFPKFGLGSLRPAEHRLAPSAAYYPNPAQNRYAVAMRSATVQPNPAQLKKLQYLNYLKRKNAMLAYHNIALASLAPKRNIANQLALRKMPESVAAYRARIQNQANALAYTDTRRLIGHLRSPSILNLPQTDRALIRNRIPQPTMPSFNAGVTFLQRYPQVTKTGSGFARNQPYHPNVNAKNTASAQQKGLQEIRELASSKKYPKIPWNEIYNYYTNRAQAKLKQQQQQQQQQQQHVTHPVAFYHATPNKMIPAFMKPQRKYVLPSVIQPSVILAKRREMAKAARSKKSEVPRPHESSWGTLRKRSSEKPHDQKSKHSRTRRHAKRSTHQRKRRSNGRKSHNDRKGRHL